MRKIYLTIVALLTLLSVNSYAGNPLTDMIIHINTNHSAGTDINLSIGPANATIYWGDGTSVQTGTITTLH